jgi:ATP-dependent exoDNAse (exonuclease V) alpha subunit
VIDEAGTVPTRSLTELLRHAAEQQMAVLLVGDHRQLPSIDAGGGLNAIATRVGAVELTENRRQISQLQQDIAASLANGRARQALDLLVENRRIQTHPTPDAARWALIHEWREHGLRDPGRTLILAHDRDDVRALNRLARYEMNTAGLLGPERLVADGREWAVGDRLVCRKNDYRPGLDIRNGTRATVTALHTGAGDLTIRTDDGRSVRLPADYLDHAHHAYAISGHISQGVTVDHTYLLATPERGGREWGYVAASRHRIDLHLHTVGESPELAVDALTRAWERTHAKTLAIDLIERQPAPDIEFTIGGPLPGPRHGLREIGPEIAEFRIGDPTRGVEPSTPDISEFRIGDPRPSIDPDTPDIDHDWPTGHDDRDGGRHRIDQPNLDIDPPTPRFRREIEPPGIDFGP